MHGRQLHLFNLFGFEVKLHRSWVFMALLIVWSLSVGYFPQVAGPLSTSAYWLMGILGALGLFFSIIFHEMFHAIFARVFGIPVHGITLFIFGGVAELDGDPKRPRDEFVMAIAGPLASVALWIFFGIFARALGLFWGPNVTAVFMYLSEINLILAIFNMLPGYPLDGGRVLRSTLWAVSGNINRATLYAARTGVFVSFMLMALGALALISAGWAGGLWWIVIGLFLNAVARASLQSHFAKEFLTREPVTLFLSHNRPPLRPDQSVQSALDEVFFNNMVRLAPVVSNGHVIGVLSIEDVSSLPVNVRASTRVEQIALSPDPERLIPSNASAFLAHQRMTMSSIKVLFVVNHNDQRFEGCVQFHDLQEYLAMKLELEGITGGLGAKYRRLEGKPVEARGPEDLHRPSPSAR